MPETRNKFARGISTYESVEIAKAINSLNKNIVRNQSNTAVLAPCHSVLSELCSAIVLFTIFDGKIGKRHSVPELKRKERDTFRPAFCRPVALERLSCFSM